jgi:hypothetical protein
MLILEQVDSIVRRIEDEKSSQEQREKTRDAIARVEGLENDKVSSRICSPPRYGSDLTSHPCAISAPSRPQAFSSICRGASLQSACHRTDQSEL